MIRKFREFNFDVDFSAGTFKSDSDIIMIENDNKSIKFLFHFEEDIGSTNALLKIKHYSGDVKEKVLSITNNTAELIVTNDILKAGNLRMSISLIGTENEILTSAEYIENIVVKEELGQGEDISEEDKSNISTAVSQVNELIEKLESINFKLNMETGKLEVELWEK